MPAQQDACSSCGFVRPAAGWPPDPLTGLILGGRYRLEGRLGAGGMASVFRASRIGALGGHVAVKVLAPRFARTVIARRFEREAQVVARLTNPHVVRIYDFDSFAFAPLHKDHPPGPALYYIAMELIEGQTLGQLLRAQGRVNFLWGIDVLRQLARGLEEAHAQGIVHRDLKPSNVILVQQRGATHVKILDFGIAALSLREQAEGAEKLTQTGFVSGTPDYMAPEQAVGDPNVGPAADMFSLGVIAFEMFSGRKPFEGATMESLLARVTKGAPALREVVSDASFPPELFRIVDKLLARDPRERYQHAGELLDDLQRFPTLQTTPDFVPPAELLERYATASARPALAHTDAAAALAAFSSAPERTTERAPLPRPPPRRSSAWIWVLALLLLGGAGTALALVLVDRGPTTPTPDAHGAPSDAATTASDAIAPLDTDLGSAADAAVPTSASLPAFLSGTRPPLEEGFTELRLPLGRDLLGLAAPTAPGPLYRPLPLRLALDRDGRPMNLAAGRLTMRLLRDGRVTGTAEGHARTADGRLAIDLPARALADTFDVALALELGGGERLTVRLRHDARTGAFSLAP